MDVHELVITCECPHTCHYRAGPFCRTISLAALNVQTCILGKVLPFVLNHHILCTVVCVIQRSLTNIIPYDEGFEFNYYIVVSIFQDKVPGQLFFTCLFLASLYS